MFAQRARLYRVLRKAQITTSALNGHKSISLLDTILQHAHHDQGRREQCDHMVPAVSLWGHYSYQIAIREREQTLGSIIAAGEVLGVYAAASGLYVAEDPHRKATFV